MTTLLGITVAAVQNLMVDNLIPNPWNVNEMDRETFEKLERSIRRYGFTAPVVCRKHPIEPGRWQIIDGEHRWTVARKLGIMQVPCAIVDVEDDTAREMGVVLNELRGRPNQVKLAELIQDLATRRDPVQLQEVLPIDRKRFEEMIHKQAIDFGQLRERAQAQQPAWVERIYRLPTGEAEVVDDALAQVMAEEGLDEDWRALARLARKHLGFD